MNGSARGVVIMAGGTGGHIFPGLAVAGVFRAQGVEVRWLGAEGGMECRQVPAHGIEIDKVHIAGVRGKGLAGWLGLPFRLLRAVREAGAFLGRSRPACALSFGGYAAGPGGIAARLRGIPLVVHEQNRVPGLTNRILARFARVVLQAFPGTFPDRFGAVTCGNPVRGEVAALPDPDARFYERRNRSQLLITGGSQGARALNKAVPAALAILPPESRPVVCHQAGRGHAESTRQAYLDAGVEAEVHEFIENMAGAYEWADLAICRAGALTVSELAAAGLGAVLVPYPHAVDDHQARNAEYLEEAGAAIIMPEPGLTAVSLARALGQLLSDRPAMLEMARRARAVAVPDSAERVVAACGQWVKP